VVASKASPLSLKGLYGLHPPYHAAALVAILKPFLSAKLRSRTALFESDAAAAATAAGLASGAAALPVAYGGTQEGFDPAWHLRKVSRARTLATNS